MDYSLLVGIHDLARGNSENIRSTTLSVYQPRVPLHRSPSKKGKEISFEHSPLKRMSTNLPNEEFLERKLSFFTSEDGGLFATNSHDEPTGDYIYYFGVIDLLTTVFPNTQYHAKIYSMDQRNISRHSLRDCHSRRVAYRQYLQTNMQSDLSSLSVQMSSRKMI